MVLKTPFFNLRLLQEKYIAKKVNLYFAFVDFEKAFYQVPWDFVLWTLKKLGVEEWLVKSMQSIYKNVCSSAGINVSFSNYLLVLVGL